MLLVPLGVAWLLFFPNAPYLMTDLVHLTVRKSRYIVDGTIQNRYWYDLVTLLLFTWSGWLTGFFSLYQFQTVVYRKSNLLLSWVFVLAACALGGYGVLLGRVYRLNSWDVLTDRHQLYQLVIDSLNWQSVFLVCLLLLYCWLSMRRCIACLMRWVPVKDVVLAEGVNQYTLPEHTGISADPPRFFIKNNSFIL